MKYMKSIQSYSCSEYGKEQPSSDHIDDMETNQLDASILSPQLNSSWFIAKAVDQGSSLSHLQARSAKQTADHYNTLLKDNVKLTETSIMVDSLNMSHFEQTAKKDITKKLSEVKVLMSVGDRAADAFQAYASYYNLNLGRDIAHSSIPMTASHSSHNSASLSSQLASENKLSSLQLINLLSSGTSNKNSVQFQANIDNNRNGNLSLESNVMHDGRMESEMLSYPGGDHATMNHQNIKSSSHAEVINGSNTNHSRMEISRSAMTSRSNSNYYDTNLPSSSSNSFGQSPNHAVPQLPSSGSLPTVG